MLSRTEFRWLEKETWQGPLIFKQNGCPNRYCYFALVTDELLAGNLGKRKLKIRITRIYMCREFLYTGL